MPLARRPASGIPPKLPVSAGYAFLLRVEEQRPAASATELSSSLERHKEVDSPPPRRRRDPKQERQEKVQTGEKIRAPEQRARSQQLP